ncbi:hypothetical protein P5673_030168 [Acropora cervicornis]|uniref:Uncharacterized protein n=1 Tax=Acropora cervicornis TaxID=6130 RepID=A0AAD9PUH5_ACRCE|nr:hypothetical protein P5673_030168 [Acropora cervicornis]
MDRMILIKENEDMIQSLSEAVIDDMAILYRLDKRRIANFRACPDIFPKPNPRIGATNLSRLN